MPAIKVLYLIIAVILATGCDRVGDLTDGVARSRFFDIGATEYELDMNRSDISSLERSLAENIYPMDTELAGLKRSLSVRDSYPPVQWKQDIMTRFNWLNQVTLLDKEGTVLSMYPEISIKKLSFAPVFPDVLSLRQGRVMLSVEHNPLGSEVLMASSVFEGFELTGLIVVGFDPRTFIARSASPEDIILVTAREVVWTGRFDHLGPSLEEIDWDDMVTRRISGKIKVDDEEFFWFARAVGENWLIYLIMTD